MAQVLAVLGQPPHLALRLLALRRELRAALAELVALRRRALERALQPRDLRRERLARRREARLARARVAQLRREAARLGLLRGELARELVAAARGRLGRLARLLALRVGELEHLAQLGALALGAAAKEARRHRLCAAGVCCVFMLLFCWLLTAVLLCVGCFACR